jgi:hypothetical protein
MNTHTVKEVDLKKIVVFPADVRYDLRQTKPFLLIKVGQKPAYMRERDDHDLKRPNSPPGTNGERIESSMGNIVK